MRRIAGPIFIVVALSAGVLLAQGFVPPPGSGFPTPVGGNATPPGNGYGPPPINGNAMPPGNGNAVPPDMAAAPAGMIAAGEPRAANVVPLDEAKTETKPLAWTKGDYTIVPYGTLWVNMLTESGRTYPGNYPLYVLRPRADANDDCYVDARSTRLGFDVLGPRVALLDCAQTGGKVEIDFQRTLDLESKPSLLLRHAYVEVKNDDFRLLAGQTWDVISPLCPGVLFYSVGWDAGNIGFRRPQFRAERYLAFSDEVLLKAQGSLNADVISDTSGTGVTAMADGWPLVEGRLAVALGPRGPGCQPWEFGVSSHVGETVYDFHEHTTAAGSAYLTSPFAFTAIGAHRPTWSLNADMRIPFTPHFGVQGELFLGENLGSFLGGAGQSVDVTGVWNGSTLVEAASGNSIRSRGGWIDIWYDWTPRLHSHVGYSIDDPVDGDVTSGRTYNAFCFANVSFDVTPKFLVGFEFSSWRTLWSGPYADATSQNYNCVVKYCF